MSGFRFAGTVSGNAPAYRLMKINGSNDSVTITSGQMVCGSTAGTIAPASSAAGPTNLWGIATDTQVESSGSYVHVISEPDALYYVSDASARYPGDTLSICDGGLTVVTAVGSTLGSLEVVAISDSLNETLVRIVVGCHVLNHSNAIAGGSTIA